MKGKNFCPAAKDGIQLLLRNPVRVGLTAGFG